MPRSSNDVNVILSEQEVRAGVERLADQISQHYGSSPLTIIGVLTGSIVLLADLIRILEMPLRVGVIQTRSYRSGIERGELTVDVAMMPDIRDRDVLLIDDIFDTGHTLADVLQLIEGLRPRSLRSAVLLNKTGRQQVEIQPDHVVFNIPDKFVVGYGLDYCDEFRNLPFIGVLNSAHIENTGDGSQPPDRME